MLSRSSPGTKLKHGHKAPLSEPAASTHHLHATSIALPWCWISGPNTGMRSWSRDVRAIANGEPQSRSRERQPLLRPHHGQTLFLFTVSRDFACTVKGGTPTVASNLLF